MIDRSRSGYLLPDGFNVVSTAFEKVVNERHISRFSQEGECLARHALKFYMNGPEMPGNLNRSSRTFVFL